MAKYKANGQLRTCNPKGEKLTIEGDVVFEGSDIHAEDLARFEKLGAVALFDVDAAADASDLDGFGFETIDGDPSADEAPASSPESAAKKKAVKKAAAKAK